MTLYLKNANYLDAETLEFRKTHLAIEPSPAGRLTFRDATPSDRELSAEDRVMDCQGRLVTHSFACGHHHIYSTLARGMPAPRTIPTNFSEILEYVWWHIDKRLDLEMIEASALASAIYCAKNGVTFVIDHHASPFAIDGSLETIARAFDSVGISHMLCYEMSDRDGAEIREQGLAETDAFLSSGRAGHVGLHASFTVGEKLLTDSIILAKKHQTGLHIHVAEDNADQEHAQANFGKRVMERLSDAGALELKKSILKIIVSKTKLGLLIVLLLAIVAIVWWLPPDLLTLDLEMPGTPTHDVFAILRKELPDLAICIVTGHPEFRKVIYDRPVPPPEGYLEKPIDGNVLLATLDELTEG